MARPATALRLPLHPDLVLVEEPALLLAVQGIVGGVEVEDDPLRRPPMGQEQIEEQVDECSTGTGAGPLRRASASAVEPYATALKQLVEATPEITLAKLKVEVERRFGIVAGLTTIHNTLRPPGLGIKKSR